jgi:hypothetical protein
MQMKSILTLLSTTAVLSLSAQITLNDTHFPGANEQYIFSATNDSIDFSQTGANQVWNYGTLTSNSQDTTITKGMSMASGLSSLLFGTFAATPYKATYFGTMVDFPISSFTSFLPVTIDDVSLFTRKTTSQINSVGYEIVFSGQGVPVKSDTIETRYELPLNYADAYTSSGYTFLDLNPIQDVQWIQRRQRSSEVDGWGSLTTPFGTFSVLRIEHTIVENDSFYISVAGFGTWIPVPTMTTHEYEWRSTSDKEAIMRVRTQEIFGTEIVTSKEYRDNPILGLSEDVSFVVSMMNPVTENLTVSLNQGVSAYAIVSENGVIYTRNAVVDNSINENVSQLTAGTYFLVLQTEKGITTKKFIKL